MKNLTKSLMIVFAFMMAGHFLIAQQQIQFEGLYTDGEGIAGWNADGSGPEPAATGHLIPGFGTQPYYGSSHDYITGNAGDAAFHFLTGMTGFPEFEQALADYGFGADAVKVKFGLASLQADIEGEDWFFFNDWAYSNYYGVALTFELDGEPLLTGFLDYVNMYTNTTAGNWQTETGYSKLNNVATNDTANSIAQAFLSDLDGKEIKLYYESTFGEIFAGNGRSGSYYDVFNGVLEAGSPEIPFRGLNADHEGFASWDADGTGPEPEGDGHGSQSYYGASLDYDGIDPDPNACLGHLLDGSTGFFNTLLQLEYRGFEIGDLKLKMGLISLGPDVEGEDWGSGWSNYYNNVFVIELNGEPVLSVLQDTNRLTSMTGYWMSGASIGKVYDISENASPEAQFVAQSFLKDLGTHYLKTNTTQIHYTELFNGNGRDGGFYEVTEGALVAVHEKATFIPEGEVNGTWTVDNSPYYVEGHLSIEDGQTLTINPGVKVAVRGPYHFTVQGSINALGTSDNNIIFTSSNPNLYWDGFDFDETPPANTAGFDWCLFQYGYAQGEGSHYNSGGIFAVKYFDNITILNSTFRNNKSDIVGSVPPCGGAIGLWNASPMIQKCIFYDNYASDYGGAILSYVGSNPVISNCLFYNNHSGNGGAIAFFEHGQGILINNTIVDNTALKGGGLYFYLQSNPEIINTILWGNEASNSGDQVYSSNPSDPDFYYCDIEEGQAGFGGTAINGGYLFNVEEDPEFMDDPHYAITDESPCYNMGTPDTSAWYYPDWLPETGLYGNPRVSYDRIDIGACEYFVVGINNNTNPAKIALSAQPNPFRNSTQIVFELTEAANVKIEIYNAIGSKIATLEDGFLLQGKHQTILNNHNLPEGVYFCRLQIENKIQTLKIIKFN